jgi:hypothetical protein
MNFTERIKEKVSEHLIAITLLLVVSLAAIIWRSVALRVWEQLSDGVPKPALWAALGLVALAGLAELVYILSLRRGHRQWKTVVARYELKSIATSVFVYALKESADTSEPPHWLCPDCFHQERKSILRRRAKDRRGTMYTCGNCKADIIDHHHTQRPSGEVLQLKEPVGDYHEDSW